MDLEKGEKHVVNFDINATTEGGAETTDDKEARRRAFANKRDNKKSTMTLLTTDNTKTYKDQDYKKAHVGESREYWRDMILGVNDGTLVLARQSRIFNLQSIVYLPLYVD